MRILAAVVLFIILSGGAHALVAVSEFGYHPAASKQAVVYTGASSGTFAIKTTSGIQVHTGTLSRPMNAFGSSVACQGGQPCLVGDFSGFTSPGTYYIEANGERSQAFQIGQGVFQLRSPLLGEFFEALRQQGSAYHANLHGAQQPPFPAMADGSFIMTTHQAASALIRMGSAYQRNPQLFSTDKYFVNRPGAPDMAEHIRMYVDYLAVLQDHDGTKMMPEGYYYNFHCSPDYDPNQERYMTSPDPCLIFNANTRVSDTAQTLLAYAQAIPAIHQVEGHAAAGTLLSRTQGTAQRLKTATPAGDDAAYYGAALFLLYDYTGDQAYLREAHALRGTVSTSLDARITKGNEFYWEEYVRHKQQLQALGLEYPHNGQDPRSFFSQKILNDWKGMGNRHAISGYGERVYIIDEGMDFQHSRSMLLEGVMAAKARALGDGDPVHKTVADAQLAWIAGANAVQSGDGAGPIISRSFLFGVGQHGRNQHLRLVSPSFYDSGRSFRNGAKYVPGWISGALDSSNDGDRILNYADDWHQWRYTESTNEIVAAAAELLALQDGHYNGRAALARPRLGGAPPSATCSYNGQTYQPGQVFPKGDGCNSCACNADGSVSCTQNTCAGCFDTVQELPASCEGSITADTFDGCRRIACSGAGGSIQVLACDKPSSSNAEYFELYRQAFTGTPPRTCIGDTCIRDKGYKRGGEFPVCTGTPAVCGNGVVESGEACDDGNTQSGDGCSSTCQLETSACHTDVQGIPASCTGGTITQDTFNGCRTIVCSGGSSSMKALACDKPSGTSPQYFELYKQSQTGTAVSRICVGQTCVDASGFARSAEYPICGNPGTGGGSVELSIKPWFPQGRSYVFLCQESGFDATQYRWEFGDGNSQVTSTEDVYHTYASAGSYTVACTASGAGMSKSDTLAVTVS